MCGILGLIDTPWQDYAGEALASIAKRGPDEQSFSRADKAIFGHTRLSVIDLATGAQPMRTPDGRYTLVFNGEIYNFRELRSELEARGYVFSTQSDTEVLLHGFAEWGRAVLPRLDGMFAFSIWDSRTNTLFAARDRLGIKPFFYSTAQGFVFASTLAPFFRLPGFPRRIDFTAVRDYLAFQTCLAPQTLLADVRQLPPACWLSFCANDKRFEQGQWWSIPAAGNEAPPFDELVDTIDAALRESVRRQLVADVPLGAFLSGGIDSSLTVRYMAETGAAPLKTFSMRFSEEGYDETSAALAVARAFDTDHMVLDAPAIDADAFVRAIGDLDQPLADPAYVMTWELSRQTRQHVTVALSGDGGDELFAGYPRFADEASLFPQRSGQKLLRRLIEAGLAPASLTRRALWGQELLLYRRAELGPWTGSRKSLSNYLRPDALDAAHPQGTLERWVQLANSFGAPMDTASLMRADLWTYLSENCLSKTDRASMAHSLEIRVPLLGQPVLDAVLSLPASTHYDKDGGKAILRQIARNSLPEAVWNREKHGFSVPLQAYFNGAWKSPCDAVIADCARIAPFLNPKAIATLWQEAKAGKASRRLAYTIVTLLLWLDKTKLQA
ncbi:asparagine synthase (glutamine-hydrolyzing) [Propionivibrio dicarboxylicus]|uniref:asparagine synthase (glutamine-hydrolyzing) n=1 Tax=Propionivibrio dicarboxylicus TaxID=83767 RepID=A0A1G8L0L3_9RHOO|nr:asparagine synthase (glutamine-hydrolyzing) [Propionivibrio dicarboxylicus]SDI49141.1 asparagine synthase (glutamine-hydrolysing) [Propionivibrio dicarboxylicus]